MLSFGLYAIVFGRMLDNPGVFPAWLAYKVFYPHLVAMYYSEAYYKYFLWCGGRSYEGNHSSYKELYEPIIPNFPGE